MTASTYRRAPVKVTVSKNSQASSASAWERRKLAQVVDVRSGCRINPGVADLAAAEPDSRSHLGG